MGDGGDDALSVLRLDLVDRHARKTATTRLDAACGWSVARIPTHTLHTPGRNQTIALPTEQIMVASASLTASQETLRFAVSTRLPGRRDGPNEDFVQASRCALCRQIRLGCALDQ
jgi:hypothetical protein